MKLWLDDRRVAPPGWVWAKGVTEAQEIIEDASVGSDVCAVDWASLDHDLGGNPGGDGTKLTDWFAEYEIWPSLGLRVHSANPSGVRTMLATVDRYSPYPVRNRFDIVRTVEDATFEWPAPDAYDWPRADIEWAVKTYGNALY